MGPAVIAVDFETEPVTDRASYPPEPIGVAIKWPGHESYYYAWGHVEGNNCDEERAKEALLAALETNLPLLFHNAKFDIDVMCKLLGEHIRVKLLPWRRIHDTLFLAFLVDPHARSHGLKDLAERHLGWPPDEKNEIGAYLWGRRSRIKEVTGKNVTRTKQGDLVVASNWYEFMRHVPADMAGRYACGDVDRTEALFHHMYDYVDRSGMMPAYDRERELLPILMENERVGIRVDVDGLETDVNEYQAAMEYVERALRSRLKAPDLNFDADQDYAAALIRAGVVDEDKFERTAKKGDYRVGKDSLKPSAFNDPTVASAVGYRNRLKTALSMFMEPWLEQGLTRNGYVSTNWNQTRGENGGTRTGRPSTTDPNFLNISKDFEGRPDGYVHPDFLNVPKLPLVRYYMLPDEGGVWCHRDFSGQELRVFAHYESGDLLAKYLEDPSLDVHGWVRDMAVQKRPDYASFDPAKLRTNIKVLNFQRIYGGGVGAAAKSLGVSEAEASEFIELHGAALPGLKILTDEIERIARRGDPIRTWGGRLYYVEEPIWKDGRLYTWYYKLLNYLVQGSAADLTKQSLIDWYNHPERDPATRFLVTVYDEINISSPISIKEHQMQVLRESMCRPRLDVPMLSDGKWGPRWGSLEKCA